MLALTLCCLAVLAVVPTTANGHFYTSLFHRPSYHHHGHHGYHHGHHSDCQCHGVHHRSERKLVFKECSHALQHTECVSQKIFRNSYCGDEVRKYYHHDIYAYKEDIHGRHCTEHHHQQHHHQHHHQSHHSEHHHQTHHQSHHSEHHHHQSHHSEHHHHRHRGCYTRCSKVGFMHIGEHKAFRTCGDAHKYLDCITHRKINNPGCSESVRAKYRLEIDMYKEDMHGSHCGGDDYYWDGHHMHYKKSKTDEAKVEDKIVATLEESTKSE